MTFVRDLSGNNPTDRKYSPYNRTANDVTAVLALSPQYPGEIVKALNTGRNYRALNSTQWGIIGPNPSAVAGTPPQPSVTINQAAGQADPATTGPILFTVVFSQDVTGFTTGDVSLAGSDVGGVLNVAVSGGPNTYTISVTGMTTGGTVIASVPAGVATGVGGLNLASTSTDNTVAWAPDLVAPTVTINKAVGQADPTSGSSIDFTVVFSETVTGFTNADVIFAGSTVGGTLAASISGIGPTYTVTVTGMAAPSGNVVASIPSSAVLDLSGNPNTASTSTDNVVAWTAPATGTALKAPLGMGLFLSN